MSAGMAGWNVQRTRVEKAARKFLTMRKILIALLFMIFLFSVSYLAFKGNNPKDSLYWTACSLSWSYCGETGVIYTDDIKILSIVNGLTTIAILAALISGVTERMLGINLNVVRMRKKISGLRGHFIICGYGRVGEKVSEVLRRNDIGYVVIEKKPEVVDHLIDSKVCAISGDAMNPHALEKAGIGKAVGLVSTLGSDSDNIFLALTAKEMNPGIMVAARAHSENVVSKLHKAGAEVVVMPEVVGGLELGREILHLNNAYKQKLISRSRPVKGEK